MLVSVFTPTHDPTYLADVYRCLKEQTHAEWEWVIVPNGASSKLIEQLVHRWAATDKRIRVYSYPPDAPQNNVGALKKFACDYCLGDLFLEYDHDDLITADCLASVVAAAKKAGSNAFIYSDDVTLNEDGTSARYDPSYGWEHYAWVHQGKTHFVNKHFDATPRSLCEILYSPDHVRVWTKEAYQLSGGHNPALPVGDDHELIVRTYLAGAEFHYIRRPLYIHKLRKNNTFIPRVEEIQKRSRKTRDQYLHALVAEWCRREQLPMLDLGGAHNCQDGYIPVDKALPEGSGPGLKIDVFELAACYKPGTVGCIRACDFLEHIPSTDIPRLFNMFYEILAPGGWLLTHTPSVSDGEGKMGWGAFQDPTHVSFWTPNNWLYYTDRDKAKYVPEIACRFQNVRMGIWFPSKQHKEMRLPYLISDCCALKDENRYWPGPRSI